MTRRPLPSRSFFTPGISELAAYTRDPATRKRWRACLDQWGYAFVAFSRLGHRELFTDEVFETFKALYAGSYSDLREAIRDQLDFVGLSAAVSRLRADHGLVQSSLDWNYGSLERWLRDGYEIFNVGGEIHLFAK
jgi:hypothetical protein